jgi:hypothetical protein
MASTATTLPQLLPTVRTLSRADKLRLIGILAEELAREEGLALLAEGEAYPVWSPHEAQEAAAALLQALRQEGIAP